MSDSRAHPRDVLGAIDGLRVAGGCEHCDAYQTVEPAFEGVWIFIIHHEDECPFWIDFQKKNPAYVKAGAWWRSPDMRKG